MSDDNGDDRSQKTVAELLALHGGSAGSSRRRRRRAADEEDDEAAAPQAERDISDTAPQAIIDRIKGEGGADQESERHSASQEHRSSRVAHRPTAQQPPAQPPQAPPASRAREQQNPPPPQQQSRPLPRPGQATNGHANGHANGHVTQQPPDQQPPDGAQAGAEQGGAEHTQQPRSRGGFPWPPGGRRAPLRPAQRREAEPNTDQFPALGEDTSGRSGHQPETPDVSAGAPPAGLAKWRQRRQREQTEDTEVGVVPPVPADAAGTAPADADGGQPTGAFTPSFDTGSHSAVGAEPGLPGYESSADDEANYADYDYYDDQGFDDQGYDDQGYDDLVYEDEHQDQDYEDQYYDEDYLDSDEEEYAEFDEPVDERSPARQWLVLAGQLALGVVAGAGVWLGFSWLWGQMPSAALVAALLATLGLVWVVRKVRRAEDTQTTVLALLVGLVVTVSPAALLLVSR